MKALLTGDVITHRISVEEGAILKGGVEVRNPEKKDQKAQSQPQSEQGQQNGQNQQNQAKTGRKRPKAMAARPPGINDNNISFGNEYVNRRFVIRPKGRGFCPSLSFLQSCTIQDKAKRREPKF
jgi:transcription initiation factor TFIID subunit TAF12